MKRIICVCSMLCFFGTCLADGEAPADDAAPTVFADISQSAIDNAVSFDGIRAFGGLGFGWQQYNASITGGNSFTSCDMNVFSLTAGIGYMKAIKNDFLIGIDILVDLSQKKKKDGDWKSLNADFDADATRRLAAPDNRTGTLETDRFAPSLGIKFGYAFKEHKTALFAKVGVSRVTGSYKYYLAGNKYSDIDVNAIIPTLGIGAEHKINRQWGVSLEANMPIKRVNKKTANSVEHRIKVGRTDIRVLGIYSLQTSGQ